MIVEDEYTLHYDSSSEEFEFDDWDGGMVRSIDFPISVSTVDDFPWPFAAVLESIASVNNAITHRNLQNDLKVHLMENFQQYKKKPNVRL